MTRTARLFLPALCLLTCAALPAPAQDAARPAHKAPAATVSAQRLKGLAVMLMMCAQDNKDVFPAMKTPAQVKKSLLPYAGAHGSTAFLEPGTTQPYRPNPQLSGRKVAQVKNPGAVVAFYEPVPAADGSRLVATADGRVGRLPKTAWAAYKRQAHLP